MNLQAGIMASKLSTNRGSWRVKHGKRLSKANPCKGLDLKSVWGHHLVQKIFMLSFLKEQKKLIEFDFEGRFSIGYENDMR